jgi:transcriptional regulator with XRE-family HTH domain
MNERLKELRKALNLNQLDFGEKIGLTNAAISKIEKGTNNLTEQNIKMICKEFNVSEDWLRTGNGEMFIQRTKNQEIMDFLGGLIEDTDEDDFRKRFVIAISKLSIDEWNVIEKIIGELNNKKEG